MRDRKRIRKFCSRLATAWEMVPDQLFGQFIMNAFGEIGKDTIFPEDDEMIRFIEGYASTHSTYHKPKKSYLDVAREKFPEATIRYLSDVHCAGSLFGHDAINCDDMPDCTYCWNQPAPDEYQEDT